MSRYLILLFVGIFTQITLFGQKQETKTFWSNSHVELSGLYGILDDNGFLLKGKKEVFNKKHFDGLLGLCFQFTYSSETDKFSDGIEGNTKDLGAYLTFDLIYYPFNKKHIFISSELFSGCTNLKSKGTLSIPEYNIYSEYQNSYSYFNYGLSETVGYDFGKIKVGAFVMMSLRTLLKKDIIIPINEDSKAYFGINFGYKL